MNKTDFIKAVTELGLSPEDYIVIGSGVMCALKIREADDIDMVVSEPVFNNLVVEPKWSKKILDDGTTVLVNGIYEIGLDRGAREGSPTLRDLKKDQVIVDEVPFMNLEWVKSLKQKRGWEKDIKDINLIEQYLSNSSL